ncbi:beta-lactamase/transpeptidase-like protein [Polyporus arcularius HHB13444]|uniref:Beta-lactamase/transpeptidase-like protein n=1 Tax=Polyporus arcularius HHB13444 TaxID=1314778 RepID=A0A5C3PR75_9APHY|nr:beta-lactamase/transpeptidase-like protein [Polyporus arcularius HHB13444]
MLWGLSSLAFAALSFHSGSFGYSQQPLATTTASKTGSERWSCRPFLPKVFIDRPPPLTHPAIREATEVLDEYISGHIAEGGIDSLSIAVVTSEGMLYERNSGVLRANETNSPPVTSHSMYRLASISKLFTVLEGMVLEQKGIISWDDPVEKYIKGFKYRLDALDPEQPHPSRAEAPITLAQLAAHMSGLGRDWPSGTAHDWPHELTGGGAPPENGLPFPTSERFFHSISEQYLVSPPWAYPSYSNTGFGVLGVALAEAASAAYGTKLNHAELLKRDIFEPLGMNGSHFLATDANKHMVVVPSFEQDIVDLDFTNTMNPAGGQFSSLSDLATLTQALLNPRGAKSLLTQYSVDKWMRPAHSFEEDDWTELGFVWEIVKARDSNDRLRRIYWKLGNIAAFHTAIAIHPGTSYGIVLLLSSAYPFASEIVYDAFEILQSAIDQALADASETLYAGHWVASGEDANTNNSTSVRIAVDRGTLYIDEFTLLGVDGLKKLGAEGRVALRPTRKDEFRIDVGIPAYNGKRSMGCFSYWATHDNWPVLNNKPINAIYFTGEGEERVLHVPSLKVAMRRG